MAFHADEANLGSYEHPWIRRAMRLVTRLTAFKAHRGMFERKGAPFVAMAFKAPWLVGREALKHSGTNAAVRIVTVHTAHRALGELVMERALELGPLIQVTTGALLIGRIRLVNHQRLFAGMHFVAGGARDLIMGVAAFEASDLSGLIQMTGETGLIGRGGRQVRRILNIAGGRPLGVRLPGTVTGLAFAAHPSLLLSSTASA